ncbi:MAG: DUF4215 domain-containing protein [Sandaracinaceae bacterium]
MPSSTRLLALSAVLTVGLAFSGCSCGTEELPDGGDAGRRDAGPALPDGGDAGPAAGRCGNGEVNAGEECDDANREDDDGCSSDCVIECGDGTVGANETCDIAIASGAGACPTDCDDSMACTSDVLSGTECTAECLSAPITAPLNGDGCCPAGATSLNDDDCPVGCGNMMLEAGELCDDGTAAPCPTMCNDGNSCTSDVLSGAASTCDAECPFDPITACSTTSDGCCPSACDSTMDADCSATCGNGTFEPPLETCEDGTATPCPTSCDDGMACTRDTLTGSAAMCNVQCGHAAITMCSTTSDGCCPGGCNAGNDADCAPVCGNSVTEAPETCDDGNTMSGDGCSSTCMLETASATAFRLTDMALGDPHAFAEIVIFCSDITGQLNMQLRNAITMDGDMMGDPGYGELDLNFLLVFRPLNQAGAGGMLDLVDASCTAPEASTSCTRMMSTPPLATATYTNTMSGSTACITATGVRPYPMPVSLPMPPCFATAPQPVTINLSGISINLRDAQIGASYVGTPATTLANGLIKGFITEADADATIIPASIALVGGMPLSAVLRGGTGNCMSGSDMDTHPTFGAGWWFYINFPARVVPYTEL